MQTQYDVKYSNKQPCNSFNTVFVATYRATQKTCLPSGARRVMTQFCTYKKKELR